jgi:hypothetical protein
MPRTGAAGADDTADNARAFPPGAAADKTRTHADARLARWPGQVLGQVPGQVPGQASGPGAREAPLVTRSRAILVHRRCRAGGEAHGNLDRVDEGRI